MARIGHNLNTLPKFEDQRSKLMRQKFLKTIGRSVTLALGLLVVTGTAALVRGQENSGAIIGAWRTVVTPRNCETGVPAPISIRGLFTFHRGGTMSEFGIGPGSSPALRSPGHGVWNREEGIENYSYAFTFNIYDVGGAYVGRQRVEGSVVFDASEDVITTTSKVNIYNAQDIATAAFCATAVGTRFQ
jgi:hypothetical protein